MATACRQEGDFGTSRWARLELDYIIHASGRKNHDRCWRSKLVAISA